MANHIINLFFHLCKIFKINVFLKIHKLFFKHAIWIYPNIRNLKLWISVFKLSFFFCYKKRDKKSDFLWCKAHYDTIFFLTFLTNFRNGSRFMKYPVFIPKQNPTFSTKILFESRLSHKVFVNKHLQSIKNISHNLFIYLLLYFI